VIDRAQGIEVRKAITQKSNPVSAVVEYLERHPAELVVLATHQRPGDVVHTIVDASNATQRPTFTLARHLILRPIGPPPRWVGRPVERRQHARGAGGWDGYVSARKSEAT
jgi:hypothetical protein